MPTSVRTLLQARYRDGATVTEEPWNDIFATLLSHRSVRAYRPDPLPEGSLERIIAAAQSAPSSSNLQTWSVVAVKDPARKDKLAEWAGGQQHVRDCPLFLVWVADLARAAHIAAERGVNLDALPYLESLVVAVIDAALAAQNAVVAAESLGLGTVYIGAIRNRLQQVATELHLPRHSVPVFGLCLGYADPATPAEIKPRLGQAAVLHHEHYSLEAQKEAIDHYDGQLRQFQVEQGLPAIGWSETLINRLRTPDALKGREHLLEALRAGGLAEH
jgi:nitroreductase